MLRPASNSCTKNHDLFFEIEGARISVDEMGQWAARRVNFNSEADAEEFGRDIAHTLYEGVARKVYIVKANSERQRVRREWIALHPPNHAGYYYCHIGGEWVHIEAADLEHITPASVERIDTSVPGWDEKLRMACRPHNTMKGSRQDVPSATLEYAPPDEAC